MTCQRVLSRRRTSVLNSLLIHYLVMVTFISYGNISIKSHHDVWLLLHWPCFTAHQMSLYGFTQVSLKIGVHEASLSVLLCWKYCLPELNYLLCWCRAHGVFSMCLVVLYLLSLKITHINIGFVCVCFSLRCYRAYGALKMVSNQPIVNTTISRKHANVSTSCWVKVEQFSYIFGSNIVNLF